MENKAMPEPKSLQEAIVYFYNPDNCIDYLAIRRCPDGRVICPSCGSDKVKFHAERRIWQCSSHHSKRQFSIKVGTVMEDSAIPLDNFWSRLKRGIGGTYVAVERFHLFRYLDEQSFWYNNRATKENKVSDADR